MCTGYQVTSSVVKAWYDYTTEINHLTTKLFVPSNEINFHNTFFKGIPCLCFFFFRLCKRSQRQRYSVTFEKVPTPYYPVYYTADFPYFKSVPEAHGRCLQ